MKHQPLALWRPIRNAFLKEYGLRQGDFELLMELHQVEYFTTEDFVDFRTKGGLKSTEREEVVLITGITFGNSLENQN